MDLSIRHFVIRCRRARSNLVFLGRFPLYQTCSPYQDGCPFVHPCARVTPQTLMIMNGSLVRLICSDNQRISLETSENGVISQRIRDARYVLHRNHITAEEVRTGNMAGKARQYRQGRTGYCRYWLFHAQPRGSTWLRAGSPDPYGKDRGYSVHCTLCVSNIAGMRIWAYRFDIP
jgi:hypothetical protein